MLEKEALGVGAVSPKAGLVRSSSSDSTSWGGVAVCF
jgi:hypothetical protein